MIEGFFSSSFAVSIMNSLVIVLFLSGMVAMIMLRTLHKDIARYNQMDSVVSICVTRNSTLHSWSRRNRNVFARFSLVSVHLHSCLFQEDAQEEFGWKLVHGDVFRPPKKGMLLSVFLGSGTQIFIMTLVTLCRSFICRSLKAETCYWSLLTVILGEERPQFSKIMQKSRHLGKQDGIEVNSYTWQDLV